MEIITGAWAPDSVVPGGSVPGRLAVPVTWSARPGEFARSGGRHRRIGGGEECRGEPAIHAAQPGSFTNRPASGGEDRPMPIPTRRKGHCGVFNGLHRVS